MMQETGCRSERLFDPAPFFVTTKITKKSQKWSSRRKKPKPYIVFFSRACVPEKSCKKDAAERVLLCFYAFERQEALRDLRASSFVFFVVTSFYVYRGPSTVD